MTKIYCDIAELDKIKYFKNNPIVKGFTTNPTLMRKAGARDYEKYCTKIARLLKNTKKTVSFEILADDFENMKRQALKINKWGKNIYVKVPVINSKGKFQGKLIKFLNEKKVKINITAVFSTDQTSKILKNINKKSKVIISIFAGRLGDSGKDPLKIIKESVNLAKNFKNVEILWASTREAFHYIQSKKIKCHIITVPPEMIDKIQNFGQSAQKLSLKTVKAFIEDGNKANFVF